jgi:hypothetical protein
MKHKNIWIIIAEVLTIVVVVLGGILVAKYRKSSETKAQVEVSHYSCNGYGLPEETGCDDTEVEKHDARVGVTFEIKELELVKFLITEVGDDYVIISASTPLSGLEDGINLNTKQTMYTIHKGKKLTLVTPTTDAEGYFEFEII